MIDKKAFPKDKVCGESFDGRVIRILNEISPDLLPQLYAEEIIRDNRSYSLNAGKHRLAISFPKSQLPRINAQRLRFDAFLYQQVTQSEYVDIQLGKAVKQIEKTPQGMIVTGKGFKISSDMAILANGAQSLLGMAQKKRNDFLFSRTYYEHLTPTPDKEVEIHFFSKPAKGCLVICPLAKGVYNVEIGIRKKEYERASLKMPTLLDEILQEMPLLAQRFQIAQPIDSPKGNFMPDDWYVQACAFDRLLLAGSNTFSVNPLTGLGVGNAMVMGKLAALQAKACIDQQDFSIKQTVHYQRAVRKRLRNVVIMHHLVNIFQKYAQVFTPILGLSISNKILGVVLQQQDMIQQFTKPSFYWKLFFGNRKSSKTIS